MFNGNDRSVFVFSLYLSRVNLVLFETYAYCLDLDKKWMN